MSLSLSLLSYVVDIHHVKFEWIIRGMCAFMTPSIPEKWQSLLFSKSINIMTLGFFGFYHAYFFDKENLYWLYCQTVPYNLPFKKQWCAFTKTWKIKILWLVNPIECFLSILRHVALDRNLWLDTILYSYDWSQEISIVHVPIQRLCM